MEQNTELSAKEKILQHLEEYRGRKLSASQIAKSLKLNRNTVTDTLRRLGEECLAVAHRSKREYLLWSIPDEESARDEEIRKVIATSPFRTLLRLSELKKAA